MAKLGELMYSTIDTKRSWKKGKMLSQSFPDRLTEFSFVTFSSAESFQILVMCSKCFI